MSNIFCLWSGGLDSTFMIEKLLKEGNTVVVGYIEILNNPRQMERERNARKIMTKNFYSRYPEKFIDMDRILSYDLNIFNEKIPLQQGALFLLSYLGIPNYSYRKIDKFALGYVMNDDALSFLEELKEVFNSFNKFANDNIELIFPIIKYKKSNMWWDLPEELRNSVVWCESSENNNCGTCNSCERMKREHIFPTKITQENYQTEFVF